MSGALQIHGDRISGNCLKVLYTAQYVGRDFVWRDVDVLKRESRTEEFLRLSPAGQVPIVITEDGRVLAQSNAIIGWLADGSALIPADPFERAKMYEWLFWEQYSHEPNIATLRYWITHKVEMTAYRKLAIEDKRARGVAALGVMETHLTANDFFAAGRFTIADIALYAYTHVAEEGGGFDLAPYPAIRAWLARVAAQPRHIPITA